MLIDWPPGLRFDGGQGCQIEQSPQFGWTALGQTPFATMMSRVIRPGIQAGERDEGICVLQGYALQSVNQCSADNRANAIYRLQVRDMFFAIRACLDQYLDSLVDTRNDLIEAFFKRLEIGAKPIYPLERHAECRTQGSQLGATFE